MSLLRSSQLTRSGEKSGDLRIDLTQRRLELHDAPRHFLARSGPTGVRMAAIEALAPLAQDVAVAGENRDFIVVLIFPNWDACRRLACCEENVEREELVGRPEIVGAVKAARPMPTQLA